jgi:P4 family phage/plasmid primase-like protien
MSKDAIDEALRRAGLPLDAGVGRDERRIAKEKELKKSLDEQMARLRKRFGLSSDDTSGMASSRWDSIARAIERGCLKEDEVNHLNCVTYILENLKVKNICQTSSNTVQYTMYYYSEQDGAYHPGAREIIRASVDNLLGEQTSTHHKKEVVDMIANKTMTDSSKVRDSHPFTEWVLLKNGRLNVMTREFKPGFTPDEVYLHPLPIYFDPEARCPEIDKFIDQVVDPEDKPLLFEIAAYGLMPGYQYHKVPMLYSPGRSGRSTYMTMLTAFFGEDNVAHVTPHALCNERFSAATLYGMRLNMAGEISIRDINDTGRFKSAVGEDVLYAENKCQQPFSFKNEAKFLFAANVLPQFRDESDGLWARIIPVEFTHNFEREGTMIENYAKLLTTGSELSGFLNRALDALQDMLRNHGFSKKPSSEGVKVWWYSKTDSVSAFTSDEAGYLVIDPNDTLIDLKAVPKDSVMEAYEEFCRKNRITAVSQKDFRKRFKDILEELVDFRTEIQPTPEQSQRLGISRYGKGKRPTCYKGVDFTEEYKQRLFRKLSSAKSKEDESKSSQAKPDLANYF